MYKPQEEDHVVGVVLEARQDEYKVDVGAAATARLPALAFDGASKKNRPNLRRGDAVYARIALAQPGIELELTCAVPHGVQPKDWVTKEALFGELVGGTLLSVPLRVCEAISANELPLLPALGRHFPFAIAAGANGRVRVSGLSTQIMVVVQRALQMVGRGVRAGVVADVPAMSDAPSVGTAPMQADVADGADRANGANGLAGDDLVGDAGAETTLAVGAGRDRMDPQPAAASNGSRKKMKKRKGGL